MSSFEFLSRKAFKVDDIVNQTAAFGPSQLRNRAGPAVSLAAQLAEHSIVFVMLKRFCCVKLLVVLLVSFFLSTSIF